MMMTMKLLQNSNDPIIVCHEDQNHRVRKGQSSLRQRLHKFINCRRRRSFHALSTSQHFKYANMPMTIGIFYSSHNQWTGRKDDCDTWWIQKRTNEW